MMHNLFKIIWNGGFNVVLIMTRLDLLTFCLFHGFFVRERYKEQLQSSSLMIETGSLWLNAGQNETRCHGKWWENNDGNENIYWIQRWLNCNFILLRGSGFDLWPSSIKLLYCFLIERKSKPTDEKLFYNSLLLVTCLICLCLADLMLHECPDTKLTHWTKERKMN